MGRKAVLIVPYGASVLLFRGPLIQALLRRGWEVVVATPDLPEEAARTEASSGVRVEHYRLSRTGVNPLADLVALQDLARLLLRLRPQAALTFQHKPNVYGFLAAALARVPVRGAVVEGLGFAFTPGQEGFRKRAVRQVLALLYKLSFSRASNRPLTNASFKRSSSTSREFFHLFTPIRGEKRWKGVQFSSAFCCRFAKSFAFCSAESEALLPQRLLFFSPRAHYALLLTPASTANHSSWRCAPGCTPQR
jgi:hypothetical protein